MNKKIYYVCQYDFIEEGRPPRNYSLAATRKIDYICDSLIHLKYDVELVSTAIVKNKQKNNYPLERHLLNNNVSLNILPCKTEKTKLGRAYCLFVNRLNLFTFLCKKCNKDDIVLVYHSYEYAVPLILAQKIKKFRLVLEVEEIYSKVWELNFYDCFKEKQLLKYADDYSLYVSECIRDKLGKKDGAISYGAYKTSEENINRIVDINKIELVFSGSTDSDRGSGFVAVEMMRFLPEYYHLSISGTVANKDKASFFSLIDEVNESLGREACTYMGVLSDTEFNELLIRANIALNPQKEGDFGDYVFPSKILTYFSFNLPVVSTKSDSIVKSSIANSIFLVDGYSPKAVAEKVKEIDLNNLQNYQSEIMMLDLNFVNSLKRSIEYRGCDND